MRKAKRAILSEAIIALATARIDVPFPNSFIKHLPRGSTQGLYGLEKRLQNLSEDALRPRPSAPSQLT